MTEAVTPARPGAVKSADRTVELLEVLSASDRRLTLTELHRELSYPKSSLYMLLQTLVNVVDFGMDLQAAVDAPRIHHQWNPDHLYVDQDVFPADVIEGLRRAGFRGGWLR